LTNAQLARVDDVASRAIAVQQFGNAVGQSVIIEIRGHTDRSGTERLNAALSRERAEAVINALVARGLSKKALRVVAMGSRAPVQRANNAYVAELNRAVTLRVVAASEAGK
jgi:OOP family OmpA-OmpF porin